jgi:DNA-binding response OmpR family regulator
MRILIVEDDRPLAQFLARGMSASGHSVEILHDGREAVTRAGGAIYDLLLLDLNLPTQDGTEVLAAARCNHPGALVMVVTGRGSLEERVRCLEMGADDYLTKPFAMSELNARISALARRKASAAEYVLRCADLELDLMAHSAKRSDREITLTGKEYLLLEFLLRNKGQCISRTTLLEQVWHLEASDTNVVDVYINYLRRKIDRGSNSPLIRTVRGGGYLMAEPARTPDAHELLAPVEVPA